MTCIRPSLVTCLALSSVALSVGLSGCGLGDTSTPVNLNNITMAGLVHGGQQPVTGSNIALYAASSSAYGATVTPLATAVTNSGGGFQITTSYTCPSNSQAYIVATGGNPGITGTVDNSAIFLMAALGPCSTIASATVNIDEVTTVAAAYALNGFLPAGGAGLTESAVLSGGAMAGIATGSGNTQGLADAFLNANNIVNYTTGLANTVPSATNSTGVVPQAVIHALADILQPCVNTSLPSSSACASLFSATTPPGTSPTMPVNVFQAAMNIARYPANNVSTLFGLLSTTPAFATTLTAAPTDWSVGIAYTNATMVSTAGLGISENDTVYVTGKNYLISFGPQGQSLSPTNLVTGLLSGDTLRQIAIDPSGNLFLTDDSRTGIWKYTPGGSSTFLDYSSTGDANPNTYAVATDKLGDAWTMSYSKAKCATAATECLLAEFPSGGTTAYTPYTSFSGNTVTQPTGTTGGPRGLAFDVNTGNIWITTINDNQGELFKVTPSATGVATATGPATIFTGLGGEVTAPATNTAYGTISVAVDVNAGAWFVTSGGPAPSGGSAVAAQLTPVSAAGVVGTGITGGGMSTPAQVTIDGNDNLFVANLGGNSVVEYDITQAAFTSGAAGFSPATSITVGATTLPALYQPSYVAVDRAGAVWASSSGSGTTHSSALVQILGLAAPTDPVLSAGKYGVKP